MKDFKGKVAVITGGASGIGLSIAERCIQEGMKVVLADINAADLAEAETQLKGSGGTVLTVRTDVSKRGDVEALAQKTLEAFGAVHLLFNNAGVGAGLTPWEATWNEWEWVIGVNLWGVINGVKIFTPIMLAQNTDCHIVNTSSAGGLIGYYPSACYSVTKHAVVALSENLCVSLAMRNAPVKVSVLCPGPVKTKIATSSRNKPAALQEKPLNPAEQAIWDSMNQTLETGMEPGEVADHVFKAIREERFYILTFPEAKVLIRERMEGILQERNPRNPFEATGTP
jgi:NAD(P)-dependent dehydrogenase (short-subunit alcohol dehydrogenase family)